MGHYSQRNNYLHLYCTKFICITVDKNHFYSYPFTITQRVVEKLKDKERCRPF